MSLAVSLPILVSGRPVSDTGEVYGRGDTGGVRTTGTV